MPVPPSNMPPRAIAALALMLTVGQPLTATVRAQSSAADPDSAAGASPARGPLPVAPAGLTSTVPADTGRPRAVTYSDAYGTRLTIHRYASYATLPVFAAEYVLGNKLIHYRDLGQPSPEGTKNAHAVVAGGLGALFAVNTVTGVWNWWDARHDPNGRARRTVHSALMLAADAGFAAAGALAGRAGNDRAGAHLHRNVALASMGVTIGAGAMMYLWKE